MTDFDREQFEHWNGPGGLRWVNEQERLDRVFAPLSAAAIAAAAPQPGERVVDVGCGCGGTTLQLAEHVGAAGSALGVDISAPMLALARQRAAQRSNARFEQADAASYAFAGDADLLFSRFGVMFFGDPPSAFANLRRALRPGGRLCLMCWRPAAENAWYTLLLRAAERVLNHTPPPPVPGAPGPFSLASAEHTRALLEHAGFQTVALRAFDTEIEVSTTGLDEAIAFALDASPIARLLLEYPHDPDARAKATAAVRAVLEAHQHGQRIALGAAVWLVTATA